MAEAPSSKSEEKAGGYGYGSGYSKKPMWLWVVLYIVLGGLVYWGIYAWYQSNNKSADGSTPSLYGGASTSGSIYNYDKK